MSRKVTLSRADIGPVLQVMPDRTTSRAGADARQLRWRQVRTSVAQALIANPSIILYGKSLGIQKVRTQLAQLHGILCRLVADIQEVIDVTRVETPDASPLSVLVEQRISGTAELSDVRSGLVSVLNQAAKSQVRGRRVISGATLASVENLIFECRERLRAVRLGALRVLGVQTLSPQINRISEESVLQSVHLLARQSATPQRTLSLAASLGALDLSARNCSLSRLVDEAADVPVKFSSRIRGTSLTLSVPANVLPIAAGDIIEVGGVASNVQAVEGRSITLANTVPSGPIIVRNTYYEQVRVAEGLLRAVLGIRDILPRGFSPVNRPEAVAACAEVVRLASRIGSLTRDAEAAAAALSIEVPESARLLERLFNTTFSFSEEIREQAREILTLLRSEGFRVAEEELTYGRYDALLLPDPQQASSLVARADELLQGIVTEVTS